MNQLRRPSHQFLKIQHNPWRLPFWLGTKAAKTQRPTRASARRRHRPTLVVDPRSSACLGGHGVVLRQHTCSLGDLDAHPRARPPHLTSFARKATRAGALMQLRRLSCCCRQDASTIGARTPYVCVHLLVLKDRSSPPFELWSCIKIAPLKLRERRRPTSCTQLVCTPRVERARGCHGYGSRGWVGHGRPSAVLATGRPRGDRRTRLSDPVAP